MLKNKQILVADDDKNITLALELLLQSKGVNVSLVHAPNALLDAASERSFDLILMDLNYSLDTTSGKEGFDTIKKLRAFDDSTPVIVMTGWASIDIAVEALKCGANDFVQKPWRNSHLLAQIETQLNLSDAKNQSMILLEENRLLKKEFGTNSIGNIVAQSAVMKGVLEQLASIACSEMNILLTGENGTGKSLLAEYIHLHSNRKNSKFISVNMGAINEQLFESEIFGHVKGAFTGAESNRVGRFELANDGTLFLDEIGNIPLSQQKKLLRILEECKFEKVGSSRTQTVNVRIISATNAPIVKLIEQNEFRKDLLYRLNTFMIEIPPLRDRIEDIKPLADQLLEKLAKKYGLNLPGLSNESIRKLKLYDWPGNVRELANMMERAVFVCRGKTIQPSDLGIEQSVVVNQGDSIATNGLTIDEIEQQVIKARLDYFEGDVLETAESLGMSRSALYRRLEKYQLT